MCILNQTDGAVRSSQGRYNFISIVLILSYILVFLIGVVGNIFVCIYFKVDNRTIKHLQLLIFCLALSDLIGSIFAPFLFIYFQWTFYQWNLGLFACKLLPSIPKLATSTSYGIIMFIHIERCIAVCFPFRSPLSMFWTRVVVLCIFCISVAFELPNLMHVVINTYECQVPFVSVESYAYPFVIPRLCRTILFISVLIVTFVIIRKELLRSEVVLTVRNNARASENRSVLRIMIAMAIFFIITVFPRELLHITYTISWMRCHEVKLANMKPVNSFLKLLQSCQCIGNVFIYAKLHVRFRRRVEKKVSNAFSSIRSRASGKKEVFPSIELPTQEADNTTMQQR